MKEKIKKLKKEKNAVILAHVYQLGEVQDIADYVGDSLDLSKKAVNIKADIIVFCGVQFMAETAAILNPDKKVLLPDKKAGCGLADMATVEQLKILKKQYPCATVVSYVNSSAAVKAESDICCTSANAVNIVNALPDNQILFAPDKNLGSYMAEYTNKDFILWEGYCYVHENITTDQLYLLKEKHSAAEIIVHPECNAPVRHLADFIGSTSQMSRYVAQSQQKEFIVGTEDNFAYRLKKDNPEKKFYPVNTHCEGMNEITIGKVKLALEKMKYKIHIPKEIRTKAKTALNRMLTIQ
ncbi:quinolinate synthase NadA [Calditrichota bacterium]